jgi:hypothetical protein
VETASKSALLHRLKTTGYARFFAPTIPYNRQNRIATLRGFQAMRIFNSTCAKALIVSALCICALAYGSDPPASSSKPGPGVLVEADQAVMLWQRDLPPKEIWLLQLTPDTLTAKASAKAKTQATIRADSGRIQAIQLASGDVFKVNPATGLFARFDPVRRIFVSEAASETATPDSLVEEAEGSGTTGDEAIRDALRNVIRKAVGVLVDGEVLVKNEDVISDKVLTYSDGFVTSYKELSRSQQDGLVRVQIRAHVEQRKLLADLHSAGVKLGPVDGQGLVASAITRKEAQDTGAALLGKMLGDLPNLLTAEVRPVNALDYDADTQLLNLSISVRVDREKYVGWADSFSAALNRIALAKESILLNMLPTLGVGDNLLDWSQAPLGPMLRFGPDLQGNPKTWCMWVVMRGEERRRTFRLGCYVLDGNIARALQGTRGKLQVEVALLGAAKEEIAKEVFDPLAGKKNQNYWLGWLAPRPRQLVANYASQATSPLLGTANLADLGPAVNADMSVNVYVVPRVIAGLEQGTVLSALGIWQPRKLKIAPDVLNRMKEIRSRVVFVSAGKSAASDSP